MKKLLALLLCLLMLVSVIPLAAYASGEEIVEEAAAEPAPEAVPEEEIIDESIPGESENLPEEILEEGEGEDLLAPSGSCGANLTWTLEKGVLTILGTGDMDDYSEENEAPWMQYSANIKVVVIAEGVTSIGDYAFASLSAMTQVTISGSVKSIGEFAFCECTALNAIVIPDSVTELGQYAMYHCQALAEAFIGTGVHEINAYTFCDCSALVKVVLGNYVERIGLRAFAGCSSLVSLTITGDTPAPTEHSLVLVPAIAPTCTEPGTALYYCCEDCGKFFADADGLVEISSADVVVDPTGHNWSDWTASEPGMESRTCANCGEVETRPATVTPSASYSYSLSLADSIAINFTVKDLAEGTDPADYRIVYTFCGETVEETLSDMTSNTFVIADTAAKEMTEEATVEVYYQDLLLKSGTYSVRSYCEAMLATKPDAKLTAMLESCLDYGTYAQLYFGYNTDDLANRGVDYGNVPATVVPAASNIKEGSCTGITGVNYSLILESRTTFQVAFSHASGVSLSDYVFTVNGVEVTPVDTGSRFVIDIHGISAKNLGDQVTVVVTNKDETSFRFVSAPVNYMYAAQYTAVGNAMKALYTYFEAAYNYFG